MIKLTYKLGDLSFQYFPILSVSLLIPFSRQITVIIWTF